MPHPLQSRLAEVRARAWRLLVGFGLARALTVLIAAALAMIVLDYAVRLEDSGLRILSTLAVAAVVVWALWRFLVQALLARHGDVELAQRVERRFPSLRDKLATAIAFLDQPDADPEAGSTQLRRAVVTSTTAAAEDLDFAEALDSKPTRRAIAAAVIVACVALALAVWQPQLAAIGIARLAAPWSPTEWPRQNDLRFRELVTQVALGQPFEVAVVPAKGTKLPDKVKLEFRYRGAPPEEAASSQDMMYVAGAMVYRQENVTRPFAYRAIGGDHQTMPWIELQVIEPPEVATLSAQLTYPAYTAWQPETTDDHINTIAGTQLSFQVATTKRVRAATLCFEDSRRIPAELNADGLGFRVPATGAEPLVVEKSGAYWFELEDERGLVAGADTRYEMQVFEDIAPSVTIEEPTANIFVMAGAEVPLSIAAKDDLALKEIKLHVLRSDKSAEGETEIALFAGPDPLAPLPRPDQGQGIHAGASESIEYRWKLAPLELQPGVQLTFHASTSDYKPQVGQSLPRRLTIITAEELQDRIAQRQSLIMNELARALQMQRAARSPTAALSIQADKMGRLNKPDVDQLQGAELAQRQVGRTLTSPTEGVLSHVQALLEDLSNNQLDSPDVVRRMNELVEELNRLNREPLPVVERELTAGLKQAQTLLEKRAGEPVPTEKVAPTAEDQQIAAAIATAGQRQDEVIESLERMLNDLGQWDNYRQFSRDLGDLRRQQRELTKQTAELGRQIVSQSENGATAQQRADLDKLGQEQLDLARQFEKLQQRMQEMAAQMADDPLAAQALTDAVELAREQMTSGRMRDAGQAAAQNQAGQASAAQKQVEQDLDEMIDTLANRREHELERLVKRLRESEQKLAELRKQQQGLRKKMREAAQEPDEEKRRQELQRLSREQKKIEEQVERLARQLQRLQADQAGQSMAQAGSRMDDAGQQGDQGNGESAAEAADRAQRDLDDAQRQLAERRKEAEADLAFEQLAKIADQLRGLRDRQGLVVEDTVRIEDLRAKQGHLSRAQNISVQQLGRQQGGLEQETTLLVEKIRDAEVFRHVLDDALAQMRQAATRLGQLDTGAPTQSATKRALRRFEQLLAALESDKDEQAGEEGGEGEGGGGQNPPTDGIAPLAQLKLLKLMQQDINARTKELEQAHGRQGQLTREQQQEFADLAQEQGKLADLARSLSQPTEAAPEDEGGIPELEKEMKPESRDPLEEGLPPILEPPQ